MSEKLEPDSLAEHEDTQEITEKRPEIKAKWRLHQRKLPPPPASPIHTTTPPLAATNNDKEEDDLDILVGPQDLDALHTRKLPALKKTGPLKTGPLQEIPESLQDTHSVTQQPVSDNDAHQQAFHDQRPQYNAFANGEAVSTNSTNDASSAPPLDDEHTPPGSIPDDTALQKENAEQDVATTSSEEAQTTETEAGSEDLGDLVPVRTSTPPPPTFRPTYTAIPPHKPRASQEALSPAAGHKNLVIFLRAILSSVLVVIAVSNALVLLNNTTPTHLNMYAFNPINGTLLTQSNLGNIDDNTTITAPLQTHSSIVLGLQQNGLTGSQKVLALTGQDASWSLQQQFSTSFPYTSISTTPNGHLLLAGRQGFQVLTPEGQLLWQSLNEQPTQGVNHFQPASDGNAVYAMNSLNQSEVAAYDIQHGTLLWKQALDDTFNYSPSPLLDNGTLYIAGDHTLYALDSKTGNQLWIVPRAVRSLHLMQQGLQSLLVAAGAQGVFAVHPSSGAIVWSFTGQSSATQTVTQFYQATPATLPIPPANTPGPVIYATGIAWNIPGIQEQVWLYALDATRGTLLWSHQIASGMLSADAARTAPLSVDAHHSLVFVQQQLDTGAPHLTAFDAVKGATRWSVVLDGDPNATPGLVQTSGGTLLLFARAHSIPLLSHILIISVISLSVLGLLLLWLIPIRQGIQRLRMLLRFLLRLPHYALALCHSIMQLWQFSRALTIFVLLCVLVSTGWLASFQWSQSQNHLYRVAARTGSVQWKQMPDMTTHTMAIDGQGSVNLVDRGDALSQLQAIRPDGSIAWKTFASEGMFSLPTVSTQAGTILVTLQGRDMLHYQFAPDDPAYPHLLDDVFALSLLDRATGKTLWRNTLVSSDTEQQMAVMGADKNFIYVTSTQRNPTTPGASDVYLMAINQQSGQTAWRIFGATEPPISPDNEGALFLWSNHIVWQVAGTLYALDPTSGQSIWRQTILNDPLTPPSQSMNQMAATADALLVARTSGIHALNPATGEELWTLPSPGMDNGQSASGVLVANQTILLYGNGQILAFDAANRHILWSQKQLASIQNLHVSEDKRTLYVALLNDSTGTTASPVVVALDIRNGSALWTFQPQNMQFIKDVQSTGFQYNHGQIFVTACFESSQSVCTYERLYTLDAQTGQAQWSIGGRIISDLSISPDGTTLQFQILSNQWQDLLELLYGTLYHD